jgi:hypothetical protein
MLHSIEMGWFVLNKYYTMSEEAPVYVAALLLDPRCRKAYLDKNWKSAWINPAIAGVRQVWEEEYNINNSVNDIDGDIVTTPEDTQSRQGSRLRSYSFCCRRWRLRRLCQQTVIT